MVIEQLVIEHFFWNSHIRVWAIFGRSLDHGVSDQCLCRLKLPTMNQCTWSMTSPLWCCSHAARLYEYSPGISCCDYFLIHAAMSIQISSQLNKAVGKDRFCGEAFVMYESHSKKPWYHKRSNAIKHLSVLAWSAWGDLEHVTQRCSYIYVVHVILEAMRIRSLGLALNLSGPLAWTSQDQHLWTSNDVATIMNKENTM